MLYRSTSILWVVVSVVVDSNPCCYGCERGLVSIPGWRKPSLLRKSTYPMTHSLMTRNFFQYLCGAKFGWSFISISTNYLREIPKIFSAIFYTDYMASFNTFLGFSFDPKSNLCFVLSQVWPLTSMFKSKLQQHYPAWHLVLITILFFYFFMELKVGLAKKRYFDTSLQHSSITFYFSGYITKLIT